MKHDIYHVVSQDWKYSPKDRALSQTLQLAELPEFVDGESVYITYTPPTGTDNGFSGKANLDVPDLTPYRNVRWDGTTGYLPAAYGEYFVATETTIKYYFSVTAERRTYGAGTKIYAAMAPERLRGGLGLVIAGQNLLFYDQDSVKQVMFTSQKLNGTYPPPDYVIVQEKSDLILRQGAGWGQSPPGPMPDLGVIYPGSSTIYLLDNLTTGTSPSVSKYAGLDSAPEYPDSPGDPYAPQNAAYTVLWFGDMNP